MHDPIEPQDLSQRLLQELAHASEQGAQGLHVQVTVPRESAYEWTDETGQPHEVHLPTRLKFAPMRYPGEPQEDGGPAAVFHIEAGGRVPAPSVVAQIGDELYRECIRWGRVHHVRPGTEPDDLPPLPDGLDDLVEAAIISDVT